MKEDSKLGQNPKKTEATQMLMFVRMPLFSELAGPNGAVKFSIIKVAWDEGFTF
jgi:hypothetical protein